MFGVGRDSGRFLNGFVSRKSRRFAGFFLIGLAALLATPPFFPSPDDFLNLFLAVQIAGFVGLSALDSLVLTYTLVPFLLFVLGVWVSPTSDRTAADGAKKMFFKVFRGISRQLQSPAIFIVTIFIFYLTYYWYLEVLGGMM